MASASVPAWKRLGLKLKYADQDAPVNSKPSDLVKTALVRGKETTSSPLEARREPSQPLKKKRKTEKHVAPTTQGQESDILLDQKSASSVARDHKNGSRVKKQVSFSSDTKALDSPKPQSPADSAGLQKPKSKPKSKIKSKSKVAKHQPVRHQTHPALEYLNQYHSARSSWKFSKNRETWLLKHIFSVNDVPRTYEIPLARYIHGLQGANARQRLRSESEKELNNETSSTNGETGTQRDTNKDEEYQMRFLQDLEEDDGKSAVESIGEHGEYTRWIQRQPRAKLVLLALGSPIASTTTNRLTSSASNTKEKKRKNRTNVIEYDSSSSSSSDSDSNSDDDDTSSDDTSSEEDDTSSSGEDSSDD
ncbi:hypothetical protein LTR84_000387 [Exophiala bonariae]|uniref:WKF domain-containing protein n=1 Tax=Exophiala bonariae TaxID=1690606 RepID=A0AAV9NQF8_9EURO|nr:hypothetical protein LTR84_000387 [Exophiala bonariae]